MERLLGGTYDRGEIGLRREFGRFWRNEWKKVGNGKKMEGLVKNGKKMWEDWGATSNNKNQIFSFKNKK